MAVGGKNAEFLFGATTTTFTTYNGDDCLQGWDLAQSINDVVYQCNGYDKHAAGTKVCSFRTSLALAATDTTKIGALAPGTTGIWWGFPMGWTTNYPKVSAAIATVISAPISAPVNGIVSMDVEIALDDITHGLG